MRSVSASLEPLSSPSPSPSPSPPPPESNERAASQPTTAGGVGLDSGSELSELTEEEQEAENRSNEEEIEEELDEGEGEEEEETEGVRRQPVRRGGGRRKRGGIVPAPMWDWAYKQKKNVERGTTAPEEEEEEEEEQLSPPKAMEEEEDEEEDSRHPSIPPSINGNAAELEDDKDEEEHEQWHAELSKKIGRPLPIFPQKSGARHVLMALQRARENGEEEDDDEEDDDEEEADVDEDEDGDIPQLNLNPTDPAHDSDSDADIDALSTKSTAALVSIVPMDVDIDGNLDITAPSPAAVAPIVAAASSIMAGSSVLASATASPDSSLSGSPTSSRSASPAPEKADDEDEDDEDDGDETTHGLKRVGMKQHSGDDEDGEPLASAASTIDGGKSKLSVKDAETEDAEAASVIHDELDLEIDADLQPAHRAEALDVLATIELKFALLRERAYVEKMEGLAWEEALVAEGTHPEFVYLQTELSRREAKRKELAARQRTYDISLVTKKRKMDEDFIWGWWKFARDELQTGMVSEHKRKYRRLERDRRALGQPQPVRHIPTVPRDIPPPPTLRQIVKSFPYPGNRLTAAKRDHANTDSPPFIYPELSTLSQADIATDLEYLYQNRRAPFDPHSHRMGMSMSVSGPQLGPTNPPMAPMQHGGYDAYAMSVDGGSASIPQYSSGSRMPPPAPPQYQQHQHLPGHQVLQPFQSGSGRSHLHPSHPQTPSSSSLHNHTQSQFPVEPEMTLVTVGPGHGHQYFSGPAPSAPLGISRPISPVHVGGGGPGMTGPGGKQSGWVGDGRIPGSHHSGGKQGPEYGWMGMHDAVEDSRERERERERESKRDRERDKRERSDRERDREREFERERDYLMQQQTPQPHRHAPPHQHSHPHNTPAQSSHHHQVPHHHHRHHHHVLHHHHPQQSGNGSGQSVPPLAIPQGTSGPGSVPSPRIATSRDFERSAHPPEVLSLSASKPGNSPSHWKRDELSSSEYREIRGRHGSRPSSTHPAPGTYEDRERPLATPFAMASSQAMSSASTPGLLNGQSSNSTRLPWSDEHGSRMPPSSSSFPGPLGRGSPLGLSPPRSRPPAPRSPSSSLAFPGQMRSPTRYPPSAPPGPPPLTDPSMMHSLASSHGRSASTPTSPGLKARGLGSPPPAKMGMGYSPPLFSGPGRTSTPTTLGPPVDSPSNAHSAPGPAFNRTASPLMSFNSPSSHPTHLSVSSRPPPNGNTLLPASKTNTVQMVDGP